MTSTPNRLIHATSPYLLQHAHNPVDWFPWGEEALHKARDEGKLILISIGYAACHWCHVMERESFTDDEVAALLAADYVCIKVDREERPDLDAHFMEILTTMTGSGGWPLHVITTPELLPLHGGTYFPPEPGWGRPSFKQLITLIATQWQERRPALLKDAHELRDWLQARMPGLPKPGGGGLDHRLGTDPALVAMRFWSERLDAEWGGFGEQPKFPQPTILSHFLRQGAHGADPAMIQPVLDTLDRMAAGGIRDQLGGAFHRYATDRAWQVPHFEIMLYDNALLARVYLEAWQLTGQMRHARVARGILDDLLNRFRLPDGAFISSLDADSAGEEGLYYTWTPEEVVAVLGEERGGAFIERFLPDTPEALVDGRVVVNFLGASHTLWESLDGQAGELAALARERAMRPEPARDDKVLVSWNALTISALAKVGAALEVPGYLEAARLALDAINRDPLVHSRRGERVGEGVFLDDYACLIQALLDGHEAWFDPALLQRAETLAREMLQRFQPASGAPLQLTPIDARSGIPPRVEWHDGVIPSGLSVAMNVLHRLAARNPEGELASETRRIWAGLAGCWRQGAPMVTEMLWSLAFIGQGSCEVVISGQGDQELALSREIRRRLLPGLVLRRETGEGVLSVRVCQKGTCHQPVATVEELRRLLEG
ncbi:MAG: thioredoxin domain-containing protein [Magnetococcales bacterium]|nr:thioredoxin domain-containing protein [Magnetococcales bacterium]